MKDTTIELPNQELKTAITGLGKIVGRKTTLPVLSSIKVSRNNLGIVSMEGTDLDSTATYTFKEAQAGNPVEFLIPLEPLTKLAKGTKDRVCLRPEGKSVVIQTFVGTTPVDNPVGCVDLKEWPGLPKVQENGITLDQTFRDTLKEALECSSTDQTRYILNGVYLDVEDPKAHYMVSTNGKILFSANSFSFPLKQSIVLPNRKFLAWNGWWTEGEAKLAVQEPVNGRDTSMIKVTADQWIFTTRGIEGNYPKWKVVVPNDQPKVRITIPEGSIDSVLHVIARIPGDDQSNHDLVLNISEKTFVLQGRGKDQDQFASVPILDAEVVGSPVIVTLDRFFMATALRFGLNTIEVLDNESPVIFKRGGKKMVVMPLWTEKVPVSAPQQQATTEPKPSTSTTPPAPAPTTSEPAQPTERNEMPKETTAPVANQQPESPLKQLVQQLEAIKTSLKAVLAELASAADVVRKAEKEKKHTEKEIEAIREKLREIQSVSI